MHVRSEKEINREAVFNFSVCQKGGTKHLPRKDFFGMEVYHASFSRRLSENKDAVMEIKLAVMKRNQYLLAGRPGFDYRGSFASGGSGGLSKRLFSDLQYLARREERGARAVRSTGVNCSARLQRDVEIPNLSLSKGGIKYSDTF